MSELVDDIKASKQELINRGWVSGDLYKEGRVCALGAVGMAMVEEFEEWVRHDDFAAFDLIMSDDRAMNVVKALAQYTPETLDNRPEDRVWRFNDRHDHTTKDILDLFDKALADLGGLA
jgi:hypothetical protein